jgi:hypothetical protein
VTEREDALLDELGRSLDRRAALEEHIKDLWARSWELLLALPFAELDARAKAAAEELGRILPPPPEDA